MRTPGMGRPRAPAGHHRRPCPRLQARLLRNAQAKTRPGRPRL